VQLAKLSRLLAYVGPVLLGGVTGTILAACNPFEAKLIGLCETLLKERLRSPSGYQRAELSEYTTELTLEEWADLERKEPSASESIIKLKLESMEQDGSVPTRHSVYIRYDAPNAHGTLVRDLAGCEYISENGDVSRASEYNVRVNGMTSTEWLISRIQ
jgi:hypothetical protein